MPLRANLVKSLGLTRRALSSKTTPRSSTAAASQKGLRINSNSIFANESDRVHATALSNTVREIEGIVEPKFQKFSFAMSRTHDTHLLCDTVGDRLAVLAREKPNDVGYKFSLTQTSLSFAEIKQRVDEMAQNFMKLGFKKGKI